MYSVLAFAITLLQLCVVISAVALNRQDLIANFIVYGSPIYLVTHVYELNPFVDGKQFLYFVVFSFHTFKYFFLSRAFFAEDKNIQREAALVMDILYLFACGYYMKY